MAQPYQFIRIPLGPRMLEEASRRAAELPIYRQSHRGLQANQVGCIGEVVAEQVLKRLEVPVLPVYGVTHDLEVRGKRTEIKTKDRTVAPKSTYECSVPLYNAAVQCPEMYIFLSIERNIVPRESMDIFRFHTAWVVGYATDMDMNEKSMIKKAGTMEPNGVSFFTDCRNISISQLRPFMTLANETK
jgi:hypothetical protein